MKWLMILLTALSVSACAGLENEKASAEPATAPAQVGVVNHTGNYIYSSSVDGTGGGNMPAWGVGGASICCASIPRVWYPGMKVRVRWNMPIGRKDVIKEKIVEVEKYEETGSMYLHFFPNDGVRVVVSPVGPRNPNYPIPLPVKPANAQ